MFEVSKGSVARWQGFQDGIPWPREYFNCTARDFAIQLRLRYLCQLTTRNDYSILGFIYGLAFFLILALFIAWWPFGFYPVSRNGGTSGFWHWFCWRCCFPGPITNSVLALKNEKTLFSFKCINFYKYFVNYCTRFFLKISLNLWHKLPIQKNHYNADSQVFEAMLWGKNF